MNKIIYIIGVLAVLTGVALIPDIPTPQKIALDGALLILLYIGYESLYNR